MFKRLGFIVFAAILGLTSCKKEDTLLTPPTTPAPGPLPGEERSLMLTPVNESITDMIGGYYKVLPSDYDKNNDKYPVIFFLHGAGQLGNGRGELPRLLFYGTMNYIKSNLIPADFSLDNKTFTYLYFAPQFKTNFSVPDLDAFIEYVSKNWRIDPSRIYLVGMSMGGRLACNYAARYPEKVAAFVSMAGGLQDNEVREERAKSIATGNVAAWIIHNNKDQLVATEDSKITQSLLKQYNPEMEARLTLLSPMGQQNHDAWTRACKLDFKEDGHNIYEWLYQYTK